MSIPCTSLITHEAPGFSQMGHWHARLPKHAGEATEPSILHTTPITTPLRSKSSPLARSWNDIRLKLDVDVVEDARVFSMVELRARSAVCALLARVLTSRTRDLQVDAIGIVLGAVGFECCVESNDLVTKDVFSRC